MCHSKLPQKWQKLCALLTLDRLLSSKDYFTELDAWELSSAKKNNEVNDAKIWFYFPRPGIAETGHVK